MPPPPTPTEDRARGLARLSLAELADLVRSVASRGGHLEVAAVGDSMEPTIRQGDLILLGPLRAGEPRPGQVVAVQGATLWVHRVVAAEQGRLITRGDAHRTDDESVGPECVLAVVRRVRRPWRVWLQQWSRRVILRWPLSAAGDATRDRR